jgi:Ni/Fe-hydrogenase subunit HybB-like protein
MVFFDKLTHAYFPHREGTVFLFTGPYWWLFWVFQIGMGIVLPLIILFHPRAGKSVRGILIAAGSVVIGVLGERAALVIPGMAQKQALYPGEIQGIWGASGSFPITFWETTMSLGALALVATLFVLGLKYMEILPAERVPEPEKEPAEAAPAAEGSEETPPPPEAERKEKADTATKTEESAGETAEAKEETAEASEAKEEPAEEK